MAQTSQLEPYLNNVLTSLLWMPKKIHSLKHSWNLFGRLFQFCNIFFSLLNFERCRGIFSSFVAETKFVTLHKTILSLVRAANFLELNVTTFNTFDFHRKRRRRKDKRKFLNKIQIGFIENFPLAMILTFQAGYEFSRCLNEG